MYYLILFIAPKGSWDEFSFEIIDAVLLADCDWNDCDKNDIYILIYI